MRRITLAVVVTVAVLVLLFSYHTSLNSGSDSGSNDAGQTLAGAQVVGSSTVSAVTGAAVTTSGGAGPDPGGDRITVPTTSAGTVSATATTATTARTPAPTRPDRSGPSASTTSSPAATTPSATAQVAKTVRGAEEMTRYGAVQVQVTITADKITEVEALEYPTRDPMDQQINADAIPELRNQVLSAQSAKVQGVSGATYTTEGYLASVQSALDAAGFTS